MLKRLVLAALLLLPGLLLLGFLLDGQPALDQTLLWLSLQLASLTGAGLGLMAAAARAKTTQLRLGFVLAALVAWRLAYFPIMVFSGHMAALAEWVAIALGLPPFVYPKFLSFVTLLHALAAALACLVLAPPKQLWRVVGATVLALCVCVSFNQPRDLSPLPDTAWTLEQPAPPMRRAAANPYWPALAAPGYWPNQRVVLLAAALTFETIPPSPWATTVKAVLADSFEANPHGATKERVREHYHAYHSAHALIGCRRLDNCAAFNPPAAP